jgi:outer membrane murein-binding lipoprotein Lpp
MSEPALPGGDWQALLAAINRLNANVEKLLDLLAGRQEEPAGLARALERAITQSTALAGAVRALQEKSDETAAEVQTLSREQANLTRLITQVEEHVEGRDQPQGLLRDALEQIHRLSERLAILEQRGVAALPSGEPLFNDAPRRSRPAEEQPAREREEPSERAAAGELPLSSRVERLEWKQDALTRILTRLVDRLFPPQPDGGLS